MNEALKEKMISAAREVRHNARAFSGFHVGAALLCDDGDIVTACNVEIHTTMSSICAERSALVKAVSMGKNHFKAIAVASDSPVPVSPCAFCRQYLVDFNPEMKVIMAGKEGVDYVEMTAMELLPMAFLGSGLSSEELEAGKTPKP